MRRHDVVIDSSGNLQVSRKRDTYNREIKEDLIDISRQRKRKGNILSEKI